MTQILPQQPKNRPRKKPSGHVTGHGLIELLSKSTGQSKHQTELFIRNLGHLIAEEILKGKSITLCNVEEKFYSSAIVGGTLSIALGVAMGIKAKGGDEKVFVFIGDMSFESGIFYEVHKYAKNFDLPIIFVVEDNAVSTYTPTEATWNIKREIPSDVIHYTYKSKYPHYGSGKWVVF